MAWRYLSSLMSMKYYQYTIRNKHILCEKLVSAINLAKYKYHYWLVISSSMANGLSM